MAGAATRSSPSSDPLRAYKAAESTRTASERDEEITRHLPLVHSVVERLAAHLPPTVDRDDLFHSGVIGLIDAIDRFDASRDNAFSTYAVLRIRGSIIDELRARDWIPRGARARSREYHQAVQDLQAELGRAPSDAELAAHLGVSEDDLVEIERAAQLAVQVSLETPVGEDGRLGATLSAQTGAEDDPSTGLAREDLRRVLLEALEDLDEKDRIVLKLYYFEGLYMKEIAELLGRTESRVCQIHTRLMALLRGRLKDAGLL